MMRLFVTVAVAFGVSADKHHQLRASLAEAPAAAAAEKPKPAAAEKSPAAEKPAADKPAGPISTGLDDPMPLKAAEQGFEGKEVQHVNQSTMTGDWCREFGPKGPQPMPPKEPEKAPAKTDDA